MPFYKGEHIKFDVMPNQLPLTVEHDSVVIEVIAHHVIKTICAVVSCWIIVQYFWEDRMYFIFNSVLTLIV